MPFARVFSLCVLVLSALNAWSITPEEEAAEACRRDLKVVGERAADPVADQRAREARNARARAILEGKVPETELSPNGVDRSTHEFIFKVEDGHLILTGAQVNDLLRSLVHSVLTSEDPKVIETDWKSIDQILGGDPEYLSPDVAMLEGLGTDVLLEKALGPYQGTESVKAMAQGISGAFNSQAAFLEIAIRLSHRMAVFNQLAIEAKIKAIDTNKEVPEFVVKAHNLVAKTEEACKNVAAGGLHPVAGKYANLDQLDILERLQTAVVSPKVPMAYRALFERMILFQQAYHLPLPVEAVPFAEYLLAVFEPDLQRDWISHHHELSPAQLRRLPKRDLEAQTYLSRYFVPLAPDAPPRPAIRLLVP